MIIQVKPDKNGKPMYIYPKKKQNIFVRMLKFIFNAIKLLLKIVVLLLVVIILANLFKNGYRPI